MNNTTPEKKLNRKGWKILFLSFLALAGAAVLELIAFIAAILFRLPEDGLMFSTASQFAAAGSAALAMIVMGGVAWLKPSRDDVKEMFRVGWPIIAADVVLLILGCVDFFAGGMTVASAWLPKLAGTLFLCLFIGIAEEVVFRGVLLNGILAVTGRSHRGTMAAVAIVSLMFGFAHVDPSKDFATPFMAIQAALKMVQTGLFSVILCSVVLRTHRLGGAALFHGLSDFLLMIPGIVLAGEQLTTNYVNTGEEGMTTLVMYLAIIAFYLPFAIKAIRGMPRERLTYRGVFMERALEKQKQKDDQLPVAPMGLPNAA